MQMFLTGFVCNHWVCLHETKTGTKLKLDITIF